MEAIESHRCFGGTQHRFRHESQCCGSDMTFSLYLPPQASEGSVPAVYFLSGLTCTDENFVNKAGAQRAAAELGLALVVPDTSPRGLGLPGEDDDDDFGTGAGFWLDATEPPWAGHYRMETYAMQELPALLAAELGDRVGKRRAVCGHSMGGHGALVLALRHPERFASVSAFAPICAPSHVPWGRKAFRGYLGEDQAAWREHDACALIRSGHDFGAMPAPLIDQGDADPFLDEQLRPDLLQAACAETGVDVELRYQPGYDHGYFFIATFIAEHLRYHARALKL